MFYIIWDYHKVTLKDYLPRRLIKIVIIQQLNILLGPCCCKYVKKVCE